MIKDRNDLNKLKEDKTKQKKECPPGTKKMSEEQKDELLKGMKQTLKDT